MSTQIRYDSANPFKSPIKASATSTPAKKIPRARQRDVLATADLLLEQIKELENLCSTVEERVQDKRRALKELEYLVLGDTESPRTPACPVNTPINSRLYLVSPRLRGLFDFHGPGQANLDAIQSCLDYSPEAPVDLVSHEDPEHADEWEDDEEALLCPFDDKYALRESPRKVEKVLPAIPRERAGEVIESRIPRKIYVKRQASASRKLTGRPLGALTRSPSHRRRPSLRGVKPMNVSPDLTTERTMRRASWKRSILENVKTTSGAKVPPTTENKCARGTAHRKEKRKGLWSIYSVCSELGLNGTYHAI